MHDLPPNSPAESATPRSCYSAYGEIIQQATIYIYALVCQTESSTFNCEVTIRVKFRVCCITKTRVPAVPANLHEVAALCSHDVSRVEMYLGI